MQIVLGRPNEYERAKGLLKAGRHPTFIGRNTVCRSAMQGGLIFARVEDRDAAVAVIGVRNGTLLVLNVHPTFRSKGIGRQLIEFLRPNFARVVESAVPWFESCGYAKLGEIKQGRSLRTQIMVRKELIDVAGRIQRTHGAGCPCTRCIAPVVLGTGWAEQSAEGCAVSNDSGPSRPMMSVNF